MNASPTTPAQAITEIEGMERDVIGFPGSAKRYWPKLLTIARSGWTEVERLTTKLEEVGQEIAHLQSAPTLPEALTELRSAEAKAQSLAEDNERLREALKPFANLLHDDVTPKDALQRQLQTWAKSARQALGEQS